jgi:hypothetical protein
MLPALLPLSVVAVLTHAEVYPSGCALFVSVHVSLRVMSRAF